MGPVWGNHALAFCAKANLNQNPNTYSPLSARCLLDVPLMRSATAKSKSFALCSWNDLSQQLRLELLTLSVPLFSETPENVCFPSDSTVACVGSASEFLSGAI